MKGTIVRELVRTAAALAIAAAIATTPGVSQAQNEDVSGEITLMSYAGIFEDQYKQAVIEPFLEEYPNVSINYFTTGNSAQMLGALRAQQSDPQVDVAIFDAGVALVGNAEGLLSEITVDEVPNLADLHPLATVQEGYGPAVTFDNLVIIYDTQDVEGSPTSLEELWNEDYDGAVGVSAMPNIQGIALTVMTASMLGEDWTKSIDGAIEKLAELAPRVQTFDPQPDGYTMVLNDSLVIATGWNARAQTFREQSDGRLGVMLPDEGSVFQINAINLVEGAPTLLVRETRAFFANPASGATTTRSPRPLAAMASHSTGRAYRSSTGMRKKPDTCGACRSSVTTRSAPAASMASAQTRARIDTRGSSFLSPLA